MAVEQADVRHLGGSARRCFTRFALVLGGGPIIFWLAAPGWRDRLGRENGEVEMASAMFFLLAGLVGCAALLRAWPNGGRRLHSVVPLLSLLAFLDEVSFGYTFIDPAACLKLWGYDVDGVHDILAVGVKLWRDHGGAMLDALVLSLLGLAIAAAFIKRRSYMPAIMAQVRRYPSFDFVRFAIILIGLAMLADLDIVDHPFARFLEEVLEMSGGIALAFAAGIMHWARGPRDDPAARKV